MPIYIYIYISACRAVTHSGKCLQNVQSCEIGGEHGLVIPVPAVTGVAVDVPDEATSPLMSLALPRLRNIVGEVAG